MGKPKEKVCRKCRDGKCCHFCGYWFDHRGYARSFLFRKNGPLHYICYSCAD
jgi:hypothetical protein